MPDDTVIWGSKIAGGPKIAVVPVKVDPQLALDAALKTGEVVALIVVLGPAPGRPTTEK